MRTVISISGISLCRGIAQDSDGSVRFDPARWNMLSASSGGKTRNSTPFTKPDTRRHPGAPQNNSCAIRNRKTLLARFNARRRRLAEPDFLLFANDHWNLQRSRLQSGRKIMAHCYAFQRILLLMLAGRNNP